jgi:hypothetical protein
MRANVVVYLYAPRRALSYCIGDDPHILALCEELNGRHLLSPADLKDNEHIRERVDMNVYCLKRDEQRVVEMMAGYRGNKRVIVAEETRTLRSKMTDRNVQSELGLAPAEDPAHKQLVFVTSLDPDPHEPKLQAIYNRYRYSRLKSPYEIPTLSHYPSDTRLVLAGYRVQKEPIEKEARSLKMQTRFHYLEADSKLVVLVRDRGD